MTRLKKTKWLFVVALAMAPFFPVWNYQMQALEHTAYMEVPMQPEIYNFLRIITSKKLLYIHRSEICDFPRRINGDLIDENSYSVKIELIPNSDKGVVRLLSKNPNHAVGLLKDFKECTNNLINSKFEKLNLDVARRLLEIFEDPQRLSIKQISLIKNTTTDFRSEIAAVKYLDANPVIYEAVVNKPWGSYVIYITIAFSLFMIVLLVFKREN